MVKNFIKIIETWNFLLFNKSYIHNKILNKNSYIYDNLNCTQVQTMKFINNWALFHNHVQKFEALVDSMFGMIAKIILNRT